MLSPKRIRTDLCSETGGAKGPGWQDLAGPAHVPWIHVRPDRLLDSTENSCTSHVSMGNLCEMNSDRAKHPFGCIYRQANPFFGRK